MVDRGFNSPNRKCSIRDFDLARLRGCPGKPGAGNPHAGFYLGGEAQGQPRLLPTDHRIDQHALLHKIKTFPTLHRLIKAWLQAGVLDHGVFAATTTGTPQGGVLSPLVANIALHGLEEFIRTHFPARTRRNLEPPGRQLHWQPQVIRYADDRVILHRDCTVIEQCHHLTQAWLQDIGLELNEQKTRIAHTLEKAERAAGFNFLGFHVGQYRARKYNTARGRGFKTLIRPSKEAVQRHWATLSALISQHKAAKQANLIGLLNPIIAGWANY